MAKRMAEVYINNVRHPSKYSNDTQYSKGGDFNLINIQIKMMEEDKAVINYNFYFTKFI